MVMENKRIIEKAKEIKTLIGKELTDETVDKINKLTDDILIEAGSLDHIKIPNYLHKMSFVAISRDFKIVAEGYTPKQAEQNAISKGYTDVWVVNKFSLVNVEEK